MLYRTLYATVYEAVLSHDMDLLVADFWEEFSDG